MHEQYIGDLQNIRFTNSKIMIAFLEQNKTLLNQTI